MEELRELLSLADEIGDFLLRRHLGPQILRQVSLRPAVVKVIKDVVMLLVEEPTQGLKNGVMMALARGAIAFGGQIGSAGRA